jgi:hypothetical protein
VTVCADGTIQMTPGATRQSSSPGALTTAGTGAHRRRRGWWAGGLSGASSRSAQYAFGRPRGGTRNCRGHAKLYGQSAFPANTSAREREAEVKK